MLYTKHNLMGSEEREGEDLSEITCFVIIFGGNGRVGELLGSKSFSSCSYRRKALFQSARLLNL